MHVHIWCLFHTVQYGTLCCTHDQSYCINTRRIEYSCLSWSAIATEQCLCVCLVSFHGTENRLLWNKYLLAWAFTYLLGHWAGVFEHLGILSGLVLSIVTWCFFGCLAQDGWMMNADRCFLFFSFFSRHSNAITLTWPPFSLLCTYTFSPSHPSILPSVAVQYRRTPRMSLLRYRQIIHHSRTKLRQLSGFECDKDSTRWIYKFREGNRHTLHTFPFILRTSCNQLDHIINSCH